MLSSVDIRGKWWVPRDPTRAIPGDLVYSGERFDLNVYGTLLPPAEIPFDVGTDIWQYRELPVVHGQSNDGEKMVTLIGCGGLVAAAPAGFGVEIHGECWHVNAAVVGAHLPMAPLFDRVDFQLEHLDEWAAVPHLERTITRDDEGQAATCSIEAAEQHLDSGTVVGIGTFDVAARPVFNIEGRHGDVALQGRIRLIPETPIGWSAAFAAAIRFRDLVRLATGHRCGITSLKVRSADANELGTNLWSELLIRTPAMLRDRDEPVRSWEMLCRLHDLPGGLAAALPRWWTLRERYGRVWELLTGQDEASFLDVAERFVASVRALETLHAIDGDGSSAAKRERDDRVERALAALPADLVEWAQPLLEESTPPFARHRVMEIIRSLGQTGNVLAGCNVELFAQRVVATRNDLVHPPVGKSKATVLIDEERFWHGKALCWISALYLLQVLGISHDQLAARLTTNVNFRRVVDKMAEGVKLRT
jgi:hypothetical protein